jgi:hypothetical protein
MVEHPFGIIKRQWGFYFVLSRKGINRAGADVGLIFTAYNLRRLMSILGIEAFKKYLKGLQKAIFSLLERFFQWGAPGSMAWPFRRIFTGVHLGWNF